MDNDLLDKLEDIDIPPIPNIAKGTTVPLQIGKIEAELLESKEKEIRKEGYRHNWRIAVFSSIFGAFAGFLSSLVFWFIENRFFS